MITDIQSGIIFCFLPINVLLMSTSMYTIEHVNKLCITYLFIYISIAIFKMKHKILV